MEQQICLAREGLTTPNMLVEYYQLLQTLVTHVTINHSKTKDVSIIKKKQSNHKYKKENS